VPWYKGAWLAPFPDRVAKGRYTFNGKEYQLPINQKQEGHALHGFTNRYPMGIAGSYVDSISATLVTHLYYDGGEMGFPFSFFAEHRYELSISGLNITTTIKNTGHEVMPFGMGWHPYFAADVSGKTVSLKVEAEGICPVDENNIPTGLVIPGNPFASFAPINYRNRKDMLFVALAMDKSKPETVAILRDELRQIEISIWQKCQTHGYAYLQVFTMDGLEGIAIEPFTCMADAFNNTDSLWKLNPGQIIKASFGVDVNALDQLNNMTSK
jgi:aldose 1-epimerase